MILSTLAFTLLNVCIKEAGDLPLLQKCIFRNLVAVVIAMVTMIRKKIPLKTSARNLPMLLARAVLGTLGMFSNFYAVAHIPLADASALTKLGPFFTVLLCFLFLKEDCSAAHVMMMAGAFFGAVLIASPSANSMQWIPYLLVIGGALCTGGAYTAIRALKDRVSPIYIVFIFSLFTLCVTLPSLLFERAPMTWMQVMWLLGAGVCAACGQIALTAAYSCAAAKELSVYGYLQIPFSAVIGILIYSEIPNLRGITGYLIIIGMGVWLYLYENRQHQQK